MNIYETITSATVEVHQWMSGSAAVASRELRDTSRSARVFFESRPEIPRPEQLPNWISWDFHQLRYPSHHPFLMGF